jgi:hypothetical protein
MCFCAFPNITLYLIIYIYRKPPATSLAPSHPRTLAPLDGIIQPPASHPRTPGWYHPATRLAPSHPWVVSSSHPPRTLAPLGRARAYSTHPQTRRSQANTLRAAGLVLAKQQSRGCRRKRIALNINYLSSPTGSRNTKVIACKALVFNTLMG